MTANDQQLAEALNGDGLPGRGGVNRGRGDAAMIWQDEVREEGRRLQGKSLASRGRGVPQAEPAGGHRYAAIQPQKTAAAARPPGGSGAARAGGGEARRQLMFPEHEKR